MISRRGESLAVLVADGDGSFARSTAEALRAVEDAVTATAVNGDGAVGERAAERDPDGVVVGDDLSAPVETVDRLANDVGLPVVVLADPAGERVVERALEAGAVDVFPRTTATAQLELVVDRLVAAPNGAAPDGETPAVDEGGHRAVFEGVSDGLVLHDPETGEIVDVNRRYCEMNGYDREELVGADVGLVSATDEGYDYETARERIREARAEGSALFEWRNEAADGETFPVAVNLSLVTVDGEELVLASVRDVTERERRERTVRRLHESTDTLQDADTPEAVCEAVVDAARDVLGLSMPVCWLREDGSETLRPVAASEAAWALPEEGPPTLSPGDPEYEAYADGEFVVQDPRETYAETPLTAALLVPLGEHGLLAAGDPDVEGFDAVARDAARILARHATVALARVARAGELRESERRFQLIAEHIDEIIYLAAADFSEILYINPAFEEIYGRPTEVLAEDPTAFVEAAHPEDRDRYERDVRQLVDDVEAGDAASVYEGGYRLQVDGEIRWVTVARFPVENGDGVVDRIVGRVRDVTARKRREREFEEIFNGVQDAIAVFDPETLDVLDANDAFLDLLGQDDLDSVREQGLGEHMVTEEGFTPERGHDIHRRVAQTGEPETFDWKGRTQDGEDRWLEVKVTPAVIGGEQVTIASHRDITERKRREREYEQIFHGVQDAVLVMDPDSLEIIDANEAYLELLGLADLAELRATGVAGLSATDAGYTVEEARAIHQRVAETGEPELVEWQAETADGERLWLEVKVAPAVINGESVNVVIHRDVTERRRLERRVRTIAAHIDEVIYLATADLSEVLYVNDAYADVFGRPVTELDDDPRAFLDAVHPEDREPFEADFRGMLEEIRAGDPEDRYEFEYRIERPDGEVRWLQQTGYPVDGADGPGRFVGVTKDVTDRRRREQTLETFHEATRALTTADSRTAACEQAVRAAAEVLGFPLVAAYLYDEDAGELRPVARTDRLADSDATLPSFGPGDDGPWQVYVDGEATTGAAVPSSLYGPGVPAPDVVVPLGTHGVMLVGAPADAFDAEDVELARILAATLEASLNHVEGKRTLESREAELRREQARAERFERLNEIIREVERVTVDRSSRAGIEEAVCERLADAPGHDLVWVGEAPVGGDGLTVRTGAGDTEAYLDALSGGVGDSLDGHPATTAYRTEEPEVVANVATDAAAGEWRRRALRHGVQSVLAVPVRDEATTHGVLVVASAEPEAFDAATTDVLAGLGRSVGYAITVTERERALESAGTTELEFAVDDEGLFPVRAAGRTGARVGLERTVRRSDGSFSTYYIVEGADPGAVVDVARAAPSVESAQVVSADEDGGLLEVTGPTWFGSPFTDAGAVVRTATADPDGGRLVVEAPQGTGVRALVKRFRERSPGAELVAKRRRERPVRSLLELQDVLRSELTDRQWEALETAYSAGYFEWPRDVDGKGVADLLGVSQPTFNKHLRVAERTAFRLLLDRDRPGEGAAAG